MMYIFEVPEGADVYALPEEVQQAVLSVRGQWPETVMTGTQAAGGRQLVLVFAEASRAQLELLITAHALDWDIVAAEGEQINQVDLIPFFADVLTYDDEGNQTGSEPVTDLTDKIQVFSGRNWIY